MHRGADAHGMDMTEEKKERTMKEIVKIKKNLIIARITTANLDVNQTVQINISYSADIDGNMDWRLDSATY